MTGTVRPPAPPGAPRRDIIDVHGRPREADGGAGWLAPALVYSGAALVGALLYRSRRTAEAERAHPPRGRFITADGARLHYVDVGEGPAVVLLHGVGTTLEDFFIAGIVERLAPHHRVIVVDRPGHGYSDRPGGIRWSPERQARSIAAMMHRLGAQEATVVGHSFGVLPAMALALQHPHYARALVLLAGCYYPGAAVAETAGLVASLPLVGPLARLTLGPALARRALPGLIEEMFEPQPPTRAFLRAYPAELVLRPGQLGASAEDAAAIEGAVRRFRHHYGTIACRTTAVTGSGDGVFDPDAQSRRFARERRGTRLVVVPAAGHMVHHSAPDRVTAAIRDTARGRAAGDDTGPPPDLSAQELTAPPERKDGARRETRKQR